MSQNTFISFTQFDARFNTVNKFSEDRSACPFFSLITAMDFMNNGESTQEQHEHTIYEAVSSYVNVNPPKYMGFNDLLQYASINTPLEVQATTVELVAAEIIGFNNFFPRRVFADDISNHNYCTIFLKNSNFFVVLVKFHETSIGTADKISSPMKDKISYHVRDCHNNEQYDFQNYEALVGHLNQTYRLSVQTIVDGVAIPEFDNIEFIIIDEPFCALF